MKHKFETKRNPIHRKSISSDEFWHDPEILFPAVQSISIDCYEVNVLWIKHHQSLSCGWHAMQCCTRVRTAVMCTYCTLQCSNVPQYTWYTTQCILYSMIFWDIFFLINSWEIISQKKPLSSTSSFQRVPWKFEVFLGEW